MITYAGFRRRLGAFLLSLLIDLAMLGLLALIGVGEYLPELWLAWYAIHHIGLVAEGGTFGHRLLALRVVCLDGSRVGFVNALIRAVVQIASFLPLGLGALWMLDERQRRTWHDLAAGTIVVREVQEQETAGPEWAAAPPWLAEQTPAEADPVTTPETPAHG